MTTRLLPFKATVGTVVLNYETPDDTVAAVGSLLGSSWLDQHVVVVDNSADPEQRQTLVSRLPETISYLATGENVGYAAGNNRGIEFLLDAGVDYVLVVNPDARVETGTVEGLVRTARRIGDAGFVGPRLVHGGSSPMTVQSDGGRVDWSRGGATRHAAGGVHVDGAPTGIAEVDYVTGACVLLRRRMLEDVGLIPEEYFLYFEETEHALLAARRGWACVVDRDVRAHHYRRSTSLVPSRAYVYYMTRNRAVFAARHDPGDDAVVRAYDDLDETFLEPWANKISVRAPALTAVFDDVVRLAKEHGRDGVVGQCEELGSYAVEGVAGWGR
ncbi:glycosyltransferase family 2 protein [Isoptericola sp. NPDC057391]|uniref:glycosyltransferase family 2 protein n=1 Tax=Isoptericola sp. NPDC057391 TaxID=3346117 RepID=UPI00363AA830